MRDIGLIRFLRGRILDIGAGVALACICLSLTPDFRNKTVLNAENRFARVHNSGDNSLIDDAPYRDALVQLTSRGVVEKLDVARDARIRDTVDAWLAVDPIGCMNFLHEKDITGFISGEQLAKVARVLGKKGIAAVLASSRRVENPRLSEKILEMAFPAAGIVNPEETLDNLVHVPEHLRARLYRNFSAAWVQRSGAPAAVKLLRNNHLPLIAVESSVQALAELDFHEAVVLLTSTPELAAGSGNAGTDGTGLLNVLFGSKSKFPADERLKAVKLLPSGGFRNEAQAIAASQLVKAGAHPLEEVIRGIDNTKVRNRVLELAVRNIVRQDPESVVGVAKLAGSLEKQSEMVAAASNYLVHRDPEQALSWAHEIAEPLVQAVALRSAGETWLRKSPSDALEYFAETLSAGNNSVMQALIPELLSKATVSPREGQKALDASMVQKLTPSARLLLRSYLQQQLPPDSWKRMAPLFE